MEKWDYFVVEFNEEVVLDPKGQISDRNKGRLDPEVIDWMGYCRQREGHWWMARLGWSPRGYLSPLTKLLRDAGEDGWELVGIIPADRNHFDLIFKRPVAG